MKAEEFNSREIGERIEAMREVRCMSQEEVCEAAGLHRNQYYRIVSGAYEWPLLRHYYQIARGLGVPVSAILGLSAECSLHPVAYKAALVMSQGLEEMERDLGLRP